MNASEIYKQFNGVEDIEIGGGLASAFAGYLAAELLLLVTRLSSGRDLGFTDDDYKRMNDQAGEYGTKLLKGSFEDIRAFGVIDGAYKLPKDTEEQIAARKQKIQEASIYATELPINNAKLCKALLDMAHSLEGKSNPNCISDLECAISLCKSGLMGCLLNVKVNLPSIKDQALVEKFSAQVSALEA